MSELLIEGYAALFGIPDQSGDVVRAGAFAHTLRSVAALPMLLQHRQGALAGRWTRRGAGLPESWTLPEADNTGRFAVQFDTGAGFGEAIMAETASAEIPAGAIAARVAEIGADGRTGKWVSIILGTS